MPSAKPNKEEVNELRSRRGIRYAEPVSRYFTALYEACLSATDDGFITEERACHLLEHLRSDPVVEAIYPNNMLAAFLTDATAPGHWSADVEHDLLHILFSFYLGYEANERTASVPPIRISISEGVVSTSREAGPYEPQPPSDLSLILTYARLKSAVWQRSLLSGHVDRPIHSLDLRDRFVGFTGKFNFGSREACFNAARRLGAVPCDPAPFMDYLFISAEFEEQGAVSSKLASAIFCRRLYGNPLILSERVWEAYARGDGVPTNA